MKKPFPAGLLTSGLALLLTITACNKKEKETPAPADLIAAKVPVQVEIPAEGICNYDAVDAAIISQGYTKVFDEDFSSNLNKWDTWASGAYNEELQCYLPANLSLANGKLAITAKKQTVTGPTDPDDNTPKTFAYTSGRIESKTLFSASATTPKVRFSARIQLPPGYGMWPAFWTYGDAWPTNGEIDILEAIGQDTYVYYTDYWYGKVPEVELTTGEASQRTIISNVDLTTCYHVYEVIWEKNTLTYLFDGKVVDTKTIAKEDVNNDGKDDDGGEYIDDFFGKKHRISLNAAIGGTMFGPDFDPSRIKPGTMYVDWVRVYTSK